MAKSKMTEPQKRLYSELDASEAGWIAISGPQHLPAEALVDMGKADCIGVRNPETGEKTAPFTGKWCWTLESTRSDFFRLK